MRAMTFAVVLSTLSACSAEAPVGAAQSETAEVSADVTRIVRAFAEDPNAVVKVERVKDIMACGTVATNGVRKRFSVDLVDEEAFFAESDAMTQAVVDMSC